MGAGLVAWCSMGERAGSTPRLTDADFRTVVETLSLPVFVVDAVGDIVFAGGSVRRDLGYDPGDLIGRNVLEFTPIEEAERAIQSIDELTRADELGIGVPTAFPIICKDGSQRWMSIGAVPLSDTPAIGTTFYFMPWDAQRHLDAFFEALLADEALNVVLGLLARSIAVSLEAVAVTVHFGFDGHRFHGVTGTCHPALLPDPESGPWRDAALSGQTQVVPVADSDGGCWSIPVPPMVDVDPAVLTVWRGVHAPPVRAHEFELNRALGYVRLALIRSAEHRRLAYLADHDHLTGLLNRTCISQMIATSLAEGGGDSALLYLDLDGFKAVNDEIGHGAGDAVLVEVARRLVGLVDGRGAVARIGGDEFTVFLEADLVSARELAEAIVSGVSRRILVQGEPVALGVSVGIAMAPAASVDELMHRADVALYEAKAAGGRQVVEHERPTG